MNLEDEFLINNVRILLGEWIFPGKDTEQLI
jgi:hypothetical protein